MHNEAVTRLDHAVSAPHASCKVHTHGRLAHLPGILSYPSLSYSLFQSIPFHSTPQPPPPPPPTTTRTTV